MIFRQKAMLRTAIRPKRKVVAGRTLRNGVARRGYRGVPVDDFRASFPLSGMTLSVVLGRTPWRAVRESYTDCREYMPLPPFVSPRPAEDVPAGCRSSAAAETAYFLTESGCESVGNILNVYPKASRTSDWAFPARSGFTTFCHRKVAPKVSAGHLRRDRTEVLTERAQKTALFCTPAPGARTAVRSDSSSGAMRNLRCAARNDDYLLVSCFNRSPACRIALRKERKDSYAPLHSARNDKSCHPQEEVQTNSDTGIAPCIAQQTAEKKAVSDRFSAHLPENRKIIRNFAGQSINCRARI